MELKLLSNSYKAQTSVQRMRNKHKKRKITVGRYSKRCVGLTTLPPSCAECLEIWDPQPPGTLWACPGL